MSVPSSVVASTTSAPDRVLTVGQPDHPGQSLAPPQGEVECLCTVGSTGKARDSADW